MRIAIGSIGLIVTLCLAVGVGSEYEIHSKAMNYIVCLVVFSGGMGILFGLGMAEELQKKRNKDQFDCGGTSLTK